MVKLRHHDHDPRAGVTVAKDDLRVEAGEALIEATANSVGEPGISLEHRALAERARINIFKLGVLHDVGTDIEQGAGDGVNNAFSVGALNGQHIVHCPSLADTAARTGHCAPTARTSVVESSTDIVIIGGGIGGLCAALSLHEVGRSVQVFESAAEIRSLGVGINLLPHAVRELDALGLLDALLAAAVTPRTLSYFSKHGSMIWSEPRGHAAGYAWPQLSIHRGTLHMVLLDAVLRRLGPDRIHTGHHLTALAHDDHGCDLSFRDRHDGPPSRLRARAVVAADGIHSVVRASLVENEGPPRWNGATLWRGVVDRAPILDGTTMVWAGHPDQKFIAYPILDLPDGRQRINFIAELRRPDDELTEREDWNRPGDPNDFAPAFADWHFPWLDVPDLLDKAPGTFVFPMVDRDPLPAWSAGRVTLLGDAAHPMYPIGSNGASQAILDGRVLAACVRDHPGPTEAFARYEAIRRPATSAIVLANRGHGPELPMKLVEERAPDGFDDIGEVISPAEIADVTEGYRRTAGFALAALADATSLLDRSY
jgi:5-methylphenazine-1-carboxylate 1-monooxygenase